MKVLVVGGGASGLLAASAAKADGHDVTVIERNARVARKVMITGKGRCNLTNLCDTDTFLSHVVRNPRFLYSALRAFGPQDMMSYIESLGVSLKVERGRRVFPCSDKAVDIVDALYRGCRGCRFVFENRVCELVMEDNRAVGVRLKDGSVLSCDAVIVATGGLSYPLTGSTGDGYRLAEQAGHAIVPPGPSLVPLEMKGNVCEALSGLSLRNVKLTVCEKDRTVYEELGEMLFTPFGVSGPLVLSASSYMKRAEDCLLKLDLKPALTWEQLDARLLRDFEKHSSQSMNHALTDLLPHRLIPVIIEDAGLNPSLRVAQLSKEMRRRLLSTLKDWTMVVTGFRPIAEAIVTRGGVDTREVDPKTMQSRLCGGLFFAGEVLDLDAHTGGYNLQIAFSTGMAAGHGVTAAYEKEAKDRG